jgi:hypothetical protein
MIKHIFKLIFIIMTLAGAFGAEDTTGGVGDFKH